MPATARFTVLDAEQPKRLVDPGVRQIANDLSATAASATPSETGQLRAGWHVERRGTSAYIVINTVPYGRYVEHGTRYVSARPMLGPAVFAARSRYA
jgi:hypothetical protein